MQASMNHPVSAPRAPETHARRALRTSWLAAGAVLAALVATSCERREPASAETVGAAGVDENAVEPTAQAEGSAAATVEESAEEGSARHAGVPTEPAEPAVDPATVAATGHGELRQQDRELFWSSPEDPPTDRLYATRPDLEGRHYLYCDEANHYRNFDRLDGLGGGYIGVGSDQAYLFIGWTKPNLAWFIDYDPWIVHLHKAYFAFFEESETFDEFFAYWHEDAEDETVDFLEERYADAEELDLITRVYRAARWRVYRRFLSLQRTHEDAEISSLVTDPERYTFVRDLIQAGRVRPMLGNLLDDEAIVGIGEVAEELDVPIRLIYLSNAEDYWNYSDQFRANMRSLHVDDESLVLRTNGARRTNGDYRYNLQPAENYQRWLAQDYVVNVRDIWPRPHIESEDHIPMTFLDEEPFDRDAEE